MFKPNAIVISVNPSNFIPKCKIIEMGLARNRFCNLVDSILLNLGFKVKYSCESLGYDDVSLIVEKYQAQISNTQLKALARIIESKMLLAMETCDGKSEIKVLVEEYEVDQEDGTLGMPVGFINY